MIEVSCALIIDGQKILVAQNRNDSDHPDKWEFPGGKVKSHETPEQSIIREIQEELNLLVEVRQNLKPAICDYGHKTIRLIPFVCSIKSGELQLNDHKAAKWVDMEQCKEIDFSEADKALLQDTSNYERLKEYLGKQMNDT
ncbi:(deoxy)nucleoside triphosphate pyrophosphohydrolase [Maribellus mangrovi]|uniref:(deoxy)nucleoside triphosphate pyrophosphohydrolase n=1 Tax=Maribellus mangrovi TaxID=3133146 RepID=UPI0030EF978A